MILLLAVVVGSKYLKLNSFQDFINHNVIDGLSRVIEGGIVIALVIAYFFKLFREIKTPSIHQEPAFWVSGGLLIYFSSNTILYLFAEFARRYSQEFNWSFWIVHSILDMLLYTTYTVALWKLRRNNVYLSSVGGGWSNVFTGTNRRYVCCGLPAEILSAATGDAPAGNSPSEGNYRRDCSGSGK
ncbi:hypothetical protein [Siphonobacter sp. SORGH_AS_0500]|uniref:hypothetical protein n=1 Tax=Siphonobacter sp. SORGH_AS_0500 TaxID=1864824 RepID=UPI0018E3C9A3|nr:hypothetical protein [Siphonobacter sp. SORGH_AS_0500]